MSRGTQPRKVLVLSDNPMSAALLGMLLELEGYEPAFAREGESPDSALARVKPLLVVLVDSALDVSRSDLFLARAARRQIGVVFFGAAGEGAATSSAWAASRRVPWCRMPIDAAELRNAIESAVAAFRLLRSGAERRRPRTETDTDGTLIYHDRDGRRWRVYDRRGSERRHAGVTPTDPDASAGERAFVNDAGEEWRVDLTAADLRNDSAAALEAQLARATRKE